MQEYNDKGALITEIKITADMDHDELEGKEVITPAPGYFVAKSANGKN